MSTEPNYSLYRKTVTETHTFVGKPDEDTRKRLAAAGYVYDSKSKQWFRSLSDSRIIEERDAA